MNSVSISEARKNLPKLVDVVDREFERVVITKSGKVKAVMLSSDELEDLQETLEILSDSRAMRAIKKAEKDIAAGKLFTHEQVFGKK